MVRSGKVSCQFDEIAITLGRNKYFLYRQLARKWHPDVNKESGAEERFKEISNAYEVLTDDNKKQIYDRYVPFELAVGFRVKRGGGVQE